MTLISESWKKLEPLKVKYGNLEPFNDYYQRIRPMTEFSHIPKTVFKQWLWAHHDKEESIKNYGWIDYKNVEFELCSWTNHQLTNIYVIKEYRDYYLNRASYNDFDRFCCIEKDLKMWRENGTWRTPPIILDINSLNDKIPDWCEIVPPFQLVEGHSRLGYLHSMFKIDKLGKSQIADEHEVYLMKIKSTNA